MSIRDALLIHYALDKEYSLPTHEQTPKLTVKGWNLDNLSVDISSCYDELQKLVQVKLE